MKTQTKKMVLLPVLIIAGLAYASIKGDNFDITTNRSIGDETSMSNTQQAPDLKFKNENGEIVSLKSLEGKVVFINLWATWCPPCIHEMPSINKLRQTFKDNADLVFLMVDVDGDIEKSKAWMKRKKFDLPVHVSAGQIPRELFSGSIPTTIIVDKNNNIVGRHVGGADYMAQEVVDLIKKLLNE